MNKLSLAGLALALSAGSALAADLPRYKAPPPPPPPMFSWTGLYAGVNVGYGFGAGGPGIGVQEYAGFQPVGAAVVALGGAGWSLPTNLSGVLGGAQLGVNYQFNSWLVLGVEADIQAAGLFAGQSSGFVPTAPVPAFAANNVSVATCSQYVDWFGTWRGRIGLTPFMPNLMIYGTAGLAYGAVNDTFNYTTYFLPPGPVVGAASGTASYDSIKFGWTAGAGLEWAPMSYPNWSLKVEYLYTDLGSTTVRTNGIGPANAVGFSSVNSATHSVSHAWHTIRAGVNYRFNFAPAPVVASY